MMFKPRIVITIATEDTRWEFSTIKGRECADGTISPGPTERQLEIARKAIAAICAAPDDTAKSTKARKSVRP